MHTRHLRIDSQQIRKSKYRDQQSCWWLHLESVAGWQVSERRYCHCGHRVSTRSQSAILYLLVATERGPISKARVCDGFRRSGFATPKDTESVWTTASLGRVSRAAHGTIGGGGVGRATKKGVSAVYGSVSMPQWKTSNAIGVGEVGNHSTYSIRRHTRLRQR